MSTAIFYDPTNTILGYFLPNGSRAFKPDGKEFELQAKIAADHYRGVSSRVELVALPKGGTPHEKRQFMFRKLRSFKLRGLRFDTIQFFGHGHVGSLNRKMVTGENVHILAKDIAGVLRPEGAVILYSCKTAKDLLNGFAKRLSDLLKRTVIGHPGSGHTTRYLYKRGMSQASTASGHIDFWPSTWAGKRDLKAQLASYPKAPFEYVDKCLASMKRPTHVALKTPTLLTQEEVVTLRDKSGGCPKIVASHAAALAEIERLRALL